MHDKATLCCHWPCSVLTCEALAMLTPSRAGRARNKKTSDSNNGNGHSTTPNGAILEYSKVAKGTRYSPILCNVTAII